MSTDVCVDTVHTVQEHQLGWGTERERERHPVEPGVLLFIQDLVVAQCSWKRLLLP